MKNGYWSNVVKVSVGVASVGTIIGLAFTAWFHIQASIADEARQRQQALYAQELQRDADEVAFDIYKVTHQLDEIEARASNNRMRKGDEVLYKQKERELEILLKRQEQVLDALEDQMKEQ